jgi:hypothetical protein
LEDMEVGDHFQNLGVYLKIILKWILEKYDGNMWIGFICNADLSGCQLRQMVEM